MLFKNYEHFHQLTSWNDAQQTLVHKIGWYTCQWLDNFDMHLYAKFDKKKYTMWFNRRYLKYDASHFCKAGQWLRLLFMMTGLFADT